jgi:hypothetical protein
VRRSGYETVSGYCPAFVEVAIGSFAGVNFDHGLIERRGFAIRAGQKIIGESDKKTEFTAASRAAPCAT